MEEERKVKSEEEARQELIEANKETDANPGLLLDKKEEPVAEEEENG